MNISKNDDQLSPQSAVSSSHSDINAGGATADLSNVTGGKRSFMDVLKAKK